jgi:26S proteasome regulatory subunit N1
VEASTDTRELIELVDVIVPHFMHHNEEPEAVDLLMEVEALDSITQHT